MRKDHLKNYLKAACKGRAHRMSSLELDCLLYTSDAADE